ncbi:hypothetical protein NQ314_015535 [Rhamnusium bicolor]|uniref:15-oxoprostaglandin 13-reductase n=1 Tax=Rhamnusium bicolor TaxID=1586634 RepID=A0AAV8WXU0_9CUCU|nr:hypothetical protein NQ314_015535 [Rhamnusium bicolor]
MVKAKVYILDKRFDGFPKEEFLAEAVYISVDPYMRIREPNLNLGDTFIGDQVAKVLESKNHKYPVGKYIVGHFGWRTHTVSDGSGSIFGGTFVLPEFGNLPLSYALGILGMPGNTAYFGFLEILKPKVGQTIAITGAAGAVGSIVGQLAKAKGLTVIGVTGSDEKRKWLVDELGFDQVINYKTADLNKVLPEVAPKGIDLYFDNVGGEISNTILKHMNHFGHISVCGAISGYNEKNPKGTKFLNNDDVNIILEELICKSNNVINSIAPIRNVVNNNNNQLPWYDEEIKIKARHRDNLYMMFKNCQNIYEKRQYWNQFKVFRNDVVNTLKIKKRMYYENKIDSNKNNPKAMWKTLKTLIKKKNHNFINNTILFEIDDRIVSFNEDADLAV